MSKRSLALAALPLSLTAALLLIQYPLKITEPTELRPALMREIRATVTGTILETRKREGDAVRTGDVIAILDLRQHRARLAELQAERAQREAELGKLRRGNRPEEIRRAEEVTARQRAALGFAKAKLARLTELHQSRLIAPESFETAQFEVESETRELARVQAELDLVRAGFRSEDVAAKRAELERIDAEITYVAAELERATVRSPCDGVLTTPRFHEKLGKAVEPGDLIAEVADFARMRVEILVPEREIDAVAVGQPVVMRVRGYPDQEFTGKVDFIPLITDFISARNLNVVRVVAYVANPGQLLKDHMTGWAEIHCERRSLLHLAARHAVRWLRVRLVI